MFNHLKSTNFMCKKLNILPIDEKFEPEKGSFLYKAFQANMELAYHSLNSDYIQGIKEGNLNPDKYGEFIVQDTFYCIKGVNSLQLALNNCPLESELYPILEYVHDAYNHYVKNTLTLQWGLKTVDSIVVRPTLLDYSNFEHEVAKTEDVIYLLITLLPCYYLWSWIAKQIEGYQEKNLYGQWILDNLDTRPTQVIHQSIQNYIIKYQQDFNEDMALALFHRAMVFEYNNFKEAL